MTHTSDLRSFGAKVMRRDCWPRRCNLIVVTVVRVPRRESGSPVETSNQPCTALEVGDGLVVDAELGGVGKVTELGDGAAVAVERGAEAGVLSRGTVWADVPVKFVALPANPGEAPGVVIEHECAGRVAG